MAGHGRLLVGGMVLMTEVVDSFYKKEPKGQPAHIDGVGGTIIAAQIKHKVGQSGNKEEAETESSG